MIGRTSVALLAASIAALTACTQSVESSETESSGIIHLPPIVNCDNWQTYATPDGFIVRLTPRAPRVYWSCPTVIVDGTSVEGLMTANVIAYDESHPATMVFGCGVGPREGLPVVYQAAWPAAADPHQPYCLFQSQTPLADLGAAIDAQIGSQVAWVGHSYNIPLPEFDPSGGSCPSCNAKKMP